MYLDIKSIEGPALVSPIRQKRYIRRRFERQNNSNSPGLRIGGVFNEMPSLEVEVLKDRLKRKDQELQELKWKVYSPVNKHYRTASLPQKLLSLNEPRYTKARPKIHSFNPITGDSFFSENKTARSALGMLGSFIVQN